MFADAFILDRAVQIYKNSHPLSITFTISKYPSKTLGQLLKRLRLERGLTQEELAKKVGVNEMTVVGWEKNERIPLKRNLFKLAKFLKIRQDVFSKEVSNKTNPWFQCIL